MRSHSSGRKRIFSRIIPSAAPVCAVFALAASFLISEAKPARATASENPAAETARLNNLGVAYMNQQLFEKALQEFRAAAAADPKFPEAQVNQGIALLNLQHIDAARELLEQAAKRDPKNPYVWYNLGLLYKNAGDTQPALDAFQHVAEIDPNDADTWYFIGSVHLQARQFAEAIAAFEKAIQLTPFHASAEFGMSRAYQQSGNSEEARKHIARFQQITQSKIGAPISLAYGEQGKYSRAQESALSPRRAPPEIKVIFVPSTKEAGLADIAAQRPSSESSKAGSGACFLDYDGDGRPDIFLASGGKQGGMALYHNLGGGKFVDVTRAAGLDPAVRAVTCAAGDYDNDGNVDMAVATAGEVLLLHNEKNGTFKNVTEAAGIRTKGPVEGLTWVDYDHDGDLDLYVLRDVAASSRGTNVMWRNNGNSTFSDVTAETDLADRGASVSAVPTDYNNDRAVDILVTGAETSIFENPREGKFISRQLWGSLPPSNGAAVFDFNKDAWMDVAFTHPKAPAVSLWRNVNGRSFERVPLPETHWTKGWGVVALDYDNDGWIDLAAVGETGSGRGEIRLFRNLGPEGFKDVTADVGLDKIELHSPRGLAAADYDANGATDLLITQIDAPPVLLRNQGGDQNHWLRLALKGLNDNKSAVGTKVEVSAGGDRQKFEISGSSYLGQSSTDLIVGLGQSKEADIVRMLWPTGVLQDEIQIAGDRRQSFIEIDRRGSSCPTLFVWDGKRFQLVADMLGAGVVGHWVAPGERNIPRPIEYVKVDRRVMQPRNRMLSFRLMEPMEEVVYLDRVELLAVDHPSDVDVYPNEYFASNPPYPPFKVVVSRNARPPAGAWDEHGHNVLPDLIAKRFFGDFELTPFKGFTKLHSLELDLGEPYGGGPLRLLLDGEIEYFTATGMYAADQAGVHGIAPYVDALDAAGKWVRVTDDMGFPAGLPRTMVADLTGRVPTGAQRIRITTNLQIYWNQILADRTEQNIPVHLHTVPLRIADLRFHGYPRQIEDKPSGNVKYVYEQVSGTGPYARQAGVYTRYGDVKPLLADFDDRLAVFGSGEEVALEFDLSSLPPVVPGWTRDYFFLANGYEKDMDFYAAEANTVDPLPFQRMGVYPPKNSFPLDDDHLNYILQYNTRYVSGDEPRGYHYYFQHMH
jgi:tetratricopeptide (TPR) repeat protein